MRQHAVLLYSLIQSPTLLYVSGHLPIKLDGSMITGSVGPGGLTIEEGQEAARWCSLGLLATIQDQLGGDLDRVEKVVKLFGIVSSKQEFKAACLWACMCVCELARERVRACVHCMRADVCVREDMCVRVAACVRACVRACVHACVRCVRAVRACGAHACA